MTYDIPLETEWQSELNLIKVNMNNIYTYILYIIFSYINHLFFYYMVYLGIRAKVSISNN